MNLIIVWLLMTCSAVPGNLKVIKFENFQLLGVGLDDL